MSWSGRSKEDWASQLLLINEAGSESLAIDTWLQEWEKNYTDCKALKLFDIDKTNLYLSFDTQVHELNLSLLMYEGSAYKKGSEQRRKVSNSIRWLLFEKAVASIVARQY